MRDAIDEFLDAPVEETGYLGTVGRGLVQGTEGLAGGVGSATRWFGDVAKAPLISEAGKTASQFWGEQAQKIAPTGPAFEGTFTENPSVKRAVHIISQAAPSLAVGMGTGVVAGPAAAAGTLGLLEGAPQYEEARESGKSVADASAIGGASTVGSAVLEYLPISHFLKGVKGNVAVRALKGGAEEAGQEVSQTLWQNILAKYGYDKTRSLAEGLVESAIGGAGTGAVAGGIFREIEPQDLSAAKQDLDNQIISTAADIERRTEVPKAQIQPLVSDAEVDAFLDAVTSDIGAMAPKGKPEIAAEKQIDPIQAARERNQQQIDQTIDEFLEGDQSWQKEPVTEQAKETVAKSPAVEATEKETVSAASPEARAAIPELKNTQDAVAFGESASKEQVDALQQAWDENKAEIDKLAAAKDFSDARMNAVYRSQFLREALEASRGEHPLQRKTESANANQGEVSSTPMVEKVPSTATEEVGTKTGFKKEIVDLGRDHGVAGIVASNKVDATEQKKRMDRLVDEVLAAPRAGWRKSESPSKNKKEVESLKDKNISQEQDDRFDKLAKEQRGKPESAMLKVQRSNGGGVLNVVVEHGGDLTHRMSQKPSFFQGGFEWVKEKVDRLHTYLNRPYGFEKELNENISNNAKARKVDEDSLRKSIDAALSVYADEHSKLKTYNEVQTLARDFAVAVGRKKWDKARKLIAKLKEHTDKGEAHWREVALKDDATPDTILPDNEGHTTKSAKPAPKGKDVGGILVEEKSPLGKMRKARKAKPSPKKKASKVSTLRGRIKKMGGINFLNFKGELKEMPPGVKIGISRKNGVPIDLAEEELKSEGWLSDNEDLLSVLRTPENMKRGMVGAEAATEFQQKEKRDQQWEYEPEEPPPGEYETVKAEDLPEGKELTIIDGNGVDGWDVYKVVDKDPFGIKLQDGTTIELSPMDEVQVLKQNDKAKEDVDDKGSYVDWSKPDRRERDGVTTELFPIYKKDGTFKSWKTKDQVERLQANIGENILELSQESYGPQAIGKGPTVGKSKQTEFNFEDPKQRKMFSTTPGTGITPQQVTKSFTDKGFKAVQDGDQVSVTLPSGRLVINVADSIVEDEDAQILMAYGREADPGEYIAGSYEKLPDKAEIRLKRNLADTQTLDHELFHHAKKAGLFTPRETMLLNRKGNEEAQARWLENQLRNRKSKAGITGKMVQRVRDFLDAIANFIGIKTERGIVRGMESGKILRRLPNGQTSSETAHSTIAGRWQSQMTSFLSDKLPGRGSPKQIRQMVDSWAKKGLIKEEELEWSGLRGFLNEFQENAESAWVKKQLASKGKAAEKDDVFMEFLLGRDNDLRQYQKIESDLKGKARSQQFSVTKQDILDYLEANHVRVEEVEKGGGTDISDEELEWSLLDIYGTVDVDGDTVYVHPELNAEDSDTGWEQFDREDAVQKILGRRGNDTKFSQYQEPGGTNYRELLLKLPVDMKKEQAARSMCLKDLIKRRDKTQSDLDQAKEWLLKTGAKDQVNDLERQIRNYDTQIDMIMREHPDSAKNMRTAYKSSHWDEPNVLAHVRFNERTDADGSKVLFLEEIQSDWHQAGRKKGYKALSDKERIDIQKKIEALAEKPRSKETDAEIKRLSELRDATTPNAPFKKTWPMLAFKRMVRYAAENGYSKIAWTPGSIHTGRWGTERIEWQTLDNEQRRAELTSRLKYKHNHPSALSKRERSELKALRMQKKGSFFVDAKSQSGGHAGGIDLEAEATARGLNPENSATVSNEKELRDAITPALTEGQDPDVLAKKLWERMQTEGNGVSMPRKEGFEGFYDKILPAAVNKFFGKKAWGGARVGVAEIPTSRPGGEELSDQENADYINRLYDMANSKEKAEWDDLDRRDDVTTAERKKFVDDLAAKYGVVKKQEVWTLPITPQMRQKALYEGMPLFASKKITETPAFKKWFGKSVVTVDGKPGSSPLVVYHGTKNDFSQFEPGRNKVAGETGFFFSPDQDVASAYAGYDEVFPSDRIGSVLPVYLKAENLKIVDMEGSRFGRGRIIAKAKKDGYDGVLLKNHLDVGGVRDQYVVFKPTQIKSAISNTTFDPNNPDIRYSTKIAEESNTDRAKAVLGRKFNDLMYWMVDKNRPISTVQRQLNKVRDEIDVFLKETQRPKITANRIRDFHQDMVEPFVKSMARYKTNLADVELYSHAKHAHEANKALRESNAKRYVGKIRDAVPKADQKKIDELSAGAQKPAEWFSVLNKVLLRFSGKAPEVAKAWESFSEKPSGLTDDEATKILKTYENDRNIEKLRMMISDINGSRLELLHDAGQIPDEEYEAIKNKYEYYVPLMREGYSDRLFGASRGIRPSGKAVKVRGGSTRKVVNIVANSIANYERAINVAEKARSQRALRDLIKENPESKVIDVSPVKKSPTYDANGNIRMYPDMFNVSDNEMRLMVDGEQYLVTVDRDNPDAMLMLRTLKAEDSMQGPILNQLSRVNQFLARINTSWSPEFIVSNFVRDLQTAGINIKDTGVKNKKMFRGAVNSWKAIWRVERGKEKGDKLETYYKRFKKAGGKIGWSDVHGSVESLAKRISRDIETESGKRPVRKTIQEWIKFVEDANTAVENGVRLHAFRLAVEQGFTDERAAQIASDLTVDFTKKGAAGPVINSLYLFANAGIQGSYRIMRAATKSKAVRRHLGYIAGSAFVIGLLNSLAGDDDDGEDYFNKIEDYIHERNAIIMIPGTKGKYAKIPLPWGYNFVWNLGTEASIFFTKERYDPLAASGRLAWVFANAFNPVASGTLLQTLSPTVADPFVQVAENKNWFGGDLMPSVNKFDRTPDPDSQRYWKSTGDLPKWVARQLNSITGGNVVKPGLVDVSPETIKMIGDTIGGSAARFFRDTLSLPYRVIRDQDIDAHQIPFLRRIGGGQSDWANSRIYFDNANEILLAKEQIKAYRGTDQYVDILRKNKQYKPLFTKLQSTEKQLRRMRKQIKTAEANGDKEGVKRIREKMEVIYKEFNLLVNSKL